MGWQVAVVIDAGTSLGSLIGWLPVWAWSTQRRRESAQELWNGWNSVWAPEPALTLINTPIGEDAVSALLAEIPTIELHHSRMTAVRIFGLSDSQELREGLSEFGYEYVSTSESEGLLYVKPFSSLDDVTDLLLDAAGWQTSNDVYNAFLRAVGAPEWHGRNFNALNDSIATGNINEIEVPYRIVIQNADAMNTEAAMFVKDFADLIIKLQARGCPVDLRIER